MSLSQMSWTLKRTSGHQGEDQLSCISLYHRDMTIKLSHSFRFGLKGRIDVSVRIKVLTYVLVHAMKTCTIAKPYFQDATTVDMYPRPGGVASFPVPCAKISCLTLRRSETSHLYHGFVMSMGQIVALCSYVSYYKSHRH